MFTKEKMNVLCLIAHPDDVELMAGGTIAKWISEGHHIHVLTYTNGAWNDPDGKSMRKKEDALTEEKKAARYLGYKVENLQQKAMDLQYGDELVAEALKRIEKLKIDTILCPWEKDLHHDHEIVSRVAVAASRRVQRVLMGQINYYLREVFTPNIFIDISATWDKKIKALECYPSQWKRAGKDWYEFLDSTSRYYGKMCGVERAEGFYSKKLLF